MNDLAKALLHDFTKETRLAKSLARWAFLAPRHGPSTSSGTSSRPT
ncbi:MAG: hypothetical protein JO344_18380 [Planctomycetaceae bacterium]|nr:hypothetical protein [Planctomycetaceae bacterium]